MPHEDDDPVYLEWLAAAPKGVRWDRAQEMYAVYQARRREQAAAVARRLLGEKSGGRMRCPECDGHGRRDWCDTCLGTGVVNA